MANFIPALQHAVQHSPYDLVRYTEYQNKLEVELVDVRMQPLVLQFDSPLLVRKMRECDAVDTLGHVQSSGGLARWIYKVEGSELVDWISQQGFQRQGFQRQGFQRSVGHPQGRDQPQPSDLLHYCILTDNSVLEILAAEEPRVLTS